jgi:choline dehydrogenase
VDNAELTRHILTQSQTLNHPLGTCGMGGGETSVWTQISKSTASRVYASSTRPLPCAPSGNTNAPTIMIAERSSVLIESG